MRVITLRRSVSIHVKGILKDRGTLTSHRLGHLDALLVANCSPSSISYTSSTVNVEQTKTLELQKGGR